MSTNPHELRENDHRRIRPQPLIPAPSTHSLSDLTLPAIWDIHRTVEPHSRRIGGSFAGVSAVSLQAQLHEGLTVLDLGCGAGLDSLVAAERVGVTGCVVAIDFSPIMLDRANRRLVASPPPRRVCTSIRGRVAFARFKY